MRRKLYHSATFWIVFVEKDCGLFCGYLFYLFRTDIFVVLPFFSLYWLFHVFLRLFSDLAYFDVNTLPRDMKGNFVFPSVPKVRGTEIFTDYFLALFIRHWVYFAEVLLYGRELSIMFCVFRRQRRWQARCSNRTEPDSRSGGLGAALVWTKRRLKSSLLHHRVQDRQL